MRTPIRACGGWKVYTSAQKDWSAPMCAAVGCVGCGVAGPGAEGGDGKCGEVSGCVGAAEASVCVGASSASPLKRNKTSEPPIVRHSLLHSPSDGESGGDAVDKGSKTNN